MPGLFSIPVFFPFPQPWPKEGSQKNEPVGRMAKAVVAVAENAKNRELKRSLDLFVTFCVKTKSKITN